MTTIATDGKTIAADGRSFLGDVWHRDDKEKIFVEDGSIFAFAGDRPIRDAVVKWYKSGADASQIPPAKNPTWTLMVVDRRGITIIDSECPYPTEIVPPFAMGSGSIYAFGAMDAGCSPEEAVKAASRRDPYTGGEIQVINIAEALSACPIQEAAE